jgi:hypothetical protein
MTQGQKAAVVFVVVLAAVGGIGWLLYQTGAESPAEGTNPLSTTPPYGKRTRFAELPPPPPPPVMEMKPVFSREPETPQARARFVVPGQEALSSRDWSDIADAYLKMRTFEQERAREGIHDVGMERMKPVLDAREKFIGASMAPPDPTIHPDRPPPPKPDPGHPAFLANLIAAMLLHEKAPLTDQQAAKVQDLAVQYGAAVDRIDARPQPSSESEEFALERTAERAKTIDDFVSDCLNVLTLPQQEIASPVEFRDRVRVDMLSASTVLGRTTFVEYTDAESLGEKMTDRMVAQFELRERRDEVKAVVMAWAARNPLEACDALDRNLIFKTRRLTGDALRTAELFRDLIRVLRLEGEPAARVRLASEIFVPLRR